MKFDSAEKIYEFSMDASAWSPNFTDEFIEVVLATSPDYDGTIERALWKQLKYRVPTIFAETLFPNTRTSRRHST